MKNSKKDLRTERTSFPHHTVHCQVNREGILGPAMIAAFFMKHGTRD